MNVLVIDAGNTRIKWGMHDGQQWIALGAVGKQESVRLGEAWKQLPMPLKIIISNVAGELVRSALTVLVGRWRVTPIWVSSQASQCGVINGYDQPAQLGVDRWAALIGARYRHEGATVVAMVGTAVTIDALTANGKFAGGFILPGLDMMMDSLIAKTAGIRVERGEFQAFPTTTRNAVWSASIQAIAGAISRMQDTLIASGEKAPMVLLSGGAASVVEPHLYGPVSRVDNLVLEGLIHIAMAR